MKKVFLIFIVAFFCISSFLIDSEGSLFLSNSMKEVPVAFQGRYRAMDAYAKIWLEKYYSHPILKAQDRPTFGIPDGSALELLWSMHFLGHKPWDQAPLFAIENKVLVHLLKLDPSRNSFAYQEVIHALSEDPKISQQVFQPFLSYHFAKKYLDIGNRSYAEILELDQVAPGLWLTLEGDDLIVTEVPATFPWKFLYPGMIVAKDARNQISLLASVNKSVSQDLADLLLAIHDYEHMTGNLLPEESAFEQGYETLVQNQLSSEEMAQLLENEHPLKRRLELSDRTLLLLPSRYQPGEWLPIRALKVQEYNSLTNGLQLASNFTLYEENTFQQLRSIYLLLEKSVLKLHKNKKEGKETEFLSQEVQKLSHKLAHKLKISFASSLAGTTYQEASTNSLKYPTSLQIQAEVTYFHYPLIEIALVTYALAILSFIFSWTMQNNSLHRVGLVILFLGFFVHTSLLGIRSFILSRPPVSNMFETLLYVPWVAVGLGLLLYFFSGLSRFLIFSATLIALILLTILQITGLNNGLENVQAVLNSQYWLIVHVLMVVGSYGAFLLSGVMGHIYLIDYIRIKGRSFSQLSKAILQTMYLGTALLISGTILGGVWAAESWGRFWDWDPKESWAFISSAMYLLVIHAYRFHKIHHFGLAIGSIIGLQVISFTWYGVNYILGTGLHSYGFGSGGEKVYFLFLIAEIIFILFLFYYKKHFEINQNKLNVILK